MIRHGGLAGAILLGLAQPLAAQEIQSEAAHVAAIEARAEENFDWASALFDAGDTDAALQTVRNSIAMIERELGEEHRLAILNRQDLGHILINLGQYGQAEVAFAHNVEIARRAHGEDSGLALDSMSGLGSAMFYQGRYSDAEDVFSQALALARNAPQADTQRQIEALNNFAQVRRELGFVDEASELQGEAAQLAADAFGRDSQVFQEAQAFYAVSLHSAGRPERAAEIMGEVLPAIEQGYGRDHPTYVMALGSYGIMLMASGQLQQAESVQAEALDLADRVLGPMHPQSMEALGNYAMLMREFGRLELARELMGEALSRYLQVQGEDHPQTLQVRQNLAMINQDIGDTGQALLYYEDTLEVLRRVRGETHPRTLQAINNLGAAWLELGDYEQADQLFVEAYASSLAVNGEAHPDTILFLSNRAIALEALGRAEAAAEAFARSIALRRETQGDIHPATLLNSTNFAYFHLRNSGRPDLAFAPARFAVRGWRERRDMLGDDPRSAARRERDQVSNGRAYQTLLDAAWEAGEAHPGNADVYRAEVLATMQDILSGSAGNAIALSAARRASEEQNEGAGRYVRERQDLSDRWIAAERELAQLLDDDSEAARDSRAALRAELARLEQSMEALDVLLRQWAPDYFTLIRPQSLAIAEAQALLTEDEAVLMLVPTELGTHALAITSEGLAWHRSDWNEGNIDYAVRRLQFDLGFDSAQTLEEINRWGLQNEALGPQAYSFWAASGLYEQLIQPLETVLAGKSHVFVMSSGALTGLPLGLLVTEAPAEGTDPVEALRSAAWLADRYALVTVPNLQSIRYLRQLTDTGDARVRPFLGFGDPVLRGPAVERGALRGGGNFGRIFAGSATRGVRGVADLEQLHSLGSLPGTARELQALWRAFGEPENALFLADAASESMVKRSDLRADVIVFATHGLLAAEAEGAGEPGLVLTPPATASFDDDGYLSMSEVAELRVDADWVILSACNTAGGSGEDASGLSGLAQAFFYAGARNLLVSHWPVDDDVAARLTVRTVELARDRPELSRAQAFQLAMAEVRQDGDNPGWVHPRAWAPFVLVGDR